MRLMAWLLFGEGGMSGRVFIRIVREVCKPMSQMPLQPVNSCCPYEETPVGDIAAAIANSEVVLRDAKHALSMTTSANSGLVMLIRDCRVL